jgi:hypothetical protein
VPIPPAANADNVVAAFAGMADIESLRFIAFAFTLKNLFSKHADSLSKYFQGL